MKRRKQKKQLPKKVAVPKKAALTREQLLPAMERVPTQYIGLVKEAGKTGNMQRVNKLVKDIEAGKLKVKSVPKTGFFWSGFRDISTVEKEGIKASIPEGIKMKNPGRFFWGPGKVEEKYLVDLKGEEKFIKQWAPMGIEEGHKHGEKIIRDRLTGEDRKFTEGLPKKMKKQNEEIRKKKGWLPNWEFNPLRKSTRYTTSQEVRDIQDYKRVRSASPGVAAIDLEKLHEKGFRVAKDPEFRSSYILVDKQGIPVKKLERKDIELVVKLDMKKVDRQTESKVREKLEGRKLEKQEINRLRMNERRKIVFKELTKMAEDEYIKRLNKKIGLKEAKKEY